MATTASIPRFLLPQITWRSSLSRVIPPLTRPHLQPAFLENRRQISTSRSPLNRSLQASTLSSIRPSPHAHLTKVLYNALVLSSRPSAPASGPSRAFHTSQPLLRDHHFDTLKFVQRLRDEGFSEEQATAMMRVLSDVIEESIQNLTRTMVPREDAERATYTQKVDFTKLRSELLQADSTETQLTKASHERLANDLAKLNSRLRDEVGRTQASVRLDLNLEKGRIREEANVQELKIKETEARIEQEVAGLRERIEGIKFSTLQWLM
ncbi:MAG: hypothetical protein MMC23_002226 [Stictis urceolatum]|nr:hypothetical protein [Stictis urceolata]